MFLLDTNVISELRRPDRANPSVVKWADSIPAVQFFISAADKADENSLALKQLRQHLLRRRNSRSNLHRLAQRRRTDHLPESLRSPPSATPAAPQPVGY